MLGKARSGFSGISEGERFKLRRLIITKAGGVLAPTGVNLTRSQK
jgi:hypothetical protein